MRCMVRNKVLFYYALYEGKQEVVDEYGNKTGQYEIIYGKPVALMGNVSPAVGETETRQFGEGVSYDRVIVLDNPKTPIDEYSILWIDTLLVISEDGTTTTPHNYIVSKVAPSLNSVSIAIRKVNVR